MSNDLAVALRRARAAKGLTIRELAAVAGVASGTVLRYERDDPGVITAKTLLKLADALDIDVTQDASGVWTVRAPGAENGHTDDTEGHSLTDGTTIVTLRIPRGFMDSLTPEQQAEVEADALLEVMRLAREVRRRTTTRGGDSP